MISDYTLKALERTIYIPENFGIDLDEDEPYEDVEELQEWAWDTFHANLYYGVSKCAIIFEGEDEVIKIPFNGSWIWDGKEDPETGEWIENEKPDFIPFHRANDVHKEAKNWDYCENELIKYEMAVGAGFEKFFADTRFLDKVNGRPLYAQEKCVSFAETSLSEHSEDSYKKWKNNITMQHLKHHINVEWVCLAIDWYGEEEVTRFLQYLIDNKLHRDLHDGNIGVSAIDGRPLLLDWAGWRDSHHN